MSLRTTVILMLSIGLGAAAVASPLDDRITAFNDATAAQDQGVVTQILKLGVQENRSAEALAAVQPWLNRNDLNSGEGLFYAGQAAERSGLWLDAIGYYQRLLLSNKPNAQQAGVAADATYHLLLNIIGDQNAAYQFMRKDGNTIRPYGDAKRYDRWFLDQARAKRDLIAVSDRLAMIARDNASDIAHFDSDFQWLCAELEHFRKEQPAVYASARSLSNEQRVPATFKARLNWASTVMPYNLKLDELRNANTPADAKLTDVPLAAAATLIKAAPDMGPMLVAKGWGEPYDGGHSGACAARFQIEGERKMAQLIAAVPKMSADQRDDLLAYPIAQGRIKFDVLTLWDFVIKHPESFNAFDAARVPLFDKAKLTVEQAKSLAPHLTRNPHPEAAMIRAIAGSGSLEVSKIIEAMAKTEAWRFKDGKDLVNTAWHASTVQDVENKALQKQYGKLDPRYEQLKQQVAKTADSKQRLAAFNTLYKDFTADAPSTPGLLVLWDELFAHAPDTDLVTMFKQLVADTSGRRALPLKTALATARFGKKNIGSMYWQGEVYDNQFRYHRKPVQDSVPELIAHLQGMIGKQAKAGTIDPHVFGMWLHTVDPKKDDAVALMQELLKSPAYLKLDASYHRSAADRNHFGLAMATPAIAQAQPSYPSRELLALPADASPQAVEAALSPLRPLPAAPRSSVPKRRPSRSRSWALSVSRRQRSGPVRRGRWCCRCSERMRHSVTTRASKATSRWSSASQTMRVSSSIGPNSSPTSRGCGTPPTPGTTTLTKVSRGW